jgi:hypothetical protein
MGFRAKNDRERRAALTSVKARAAREAVLPLKPTAGAANVCHLLPPAPCKPGGLPRISRQNLFSTFPRVKYPSFYELMAYSAAGGDGINLGYKCADACGIGSKIMLPET